MRREARWLACLASAACSHRAPVLAAGGAAADADSAGAVATAPVSLTVESHNRANVVLYIIRGSLRQRLGSVTAATTQRFLIPPDVVRDGGGFSLVASPVGGDAPGRTELLHIFPGQRIVWTLESSLVRSSIAIY